MHWWDTMNYTELIWADARSRSFTLIPWRFCTFQIPLPVAELKSNNLCYKELPSCPHLILFELQESASPHLRTLDPRRSSRQPTESLKHLNHAALHRIFKSTMAIGSVWAAVLYSVIPTLFPRSLLGKLQLELLWCRVPSSGKARDMPRLWDQPFAELEEGWKVENRRNIMVNFSSFDTNDYIFSFE